MRTALKTVKLNIPTSGEVQAIVVRGIVDSALQPDAGYDFIPKSQVQPLVDALLICSGKSWAGIEKTPKEWADSALEHAKTLGF